MARIRWTASSVSHVCEYERALDVVLRRVGIPKSVQYIYIAVLVYICVLSERV